MTQFFYIVKETFSSLIKTGNIVRDVIDIAIVAILVYYGIKLLREIRAGQLVKGILVIVGAYAVAAIFKLNTVVYIMKVIFDLGAVALIIVFQPELRRFLEKMGTGSLNPLKSLFLHGGVSAAKNEKLEHALFTISEAAASLSKTKTGALIVIERMSKLGLEVEKGGTIVNADLSVELLGTIFYEGSPLHDGAVIIRDGALYAAGCFLPLPINSDHIPKSLGSRHRAALGMSESSDAVVVVVSEETGNISVANNGYLSRDYNRASLYNYLHREIVGTAENEEADKKPLFTRGKNK